jgi:hypothetical protein
VTKSSIQPEEKTWKCVPTLWIGKFGEEMNLTELIAPGATGGERWICVAEFDCTPVFAAYPVEPNAGAGEGENA